MPTYIKCIPFKGWNPAEDVKKRSSTEWDVVSEGFSNYLERDTQQKQWSKPKMWCSLQGFCLGSVPLSSPTPWPMLIIKWLWKDPAQVFQEIPLMQMQ